MNGRGSKPYRMKCSSDKGRSARRAAELMREIIGMQGSGFIWWRGLGSRYYVSNFPTLQKRSNKTSRDLTAKVCENTSPSNE